MEDKKDLRDLTAEELEKELVSLGEPAYRGRQVFARLYRKSAPAVSFDDFTELPAALRARLADRFKLTRPEAVGRLESEDGAVKVLWRLEDGSFVETVLIPSDVRLTVCLSTQVGCKFGCSFCASGARGFKRNLKASEIIGQFLFAETPANQDITNYVFMGMGEPLDNFDELSKAIRIMNSERGLNIAARRITVSTAGYIPGLRRFKELDLQVNLAISLHAANDALRGRLMPIDRKYPLTDLIEAVEDYIRSGGRMVTIEYILCHGLNDTLNDADGLSAISRRLRAKVNLIPFSPVPGLPPEFERPTEADIQRFTTWLEERKVRVTVRNSKGRDIAAACGQLAGKTP